VTKADLNKAPGDVSAMFDLVAKNYDRTNDLLSFYQSRLWRRAVKRAVAPSAGKRILDVAAGTGTSSKALLVPGGEVVAADFSKGMIEQGKKQHPDLTFVFADAMKLPFKDSEFDVVTISFGLRNVQKYQVALSEFYRVLKPGGKLVVCEFSKVRGLIGFAYKAYLRFGLPIVARIISSNPEAYTYLSQSIEAWPNQKQLEQNIASAGFKKVSYKNLSFGVVALHTGER
jgi:demethylmenaquinone methyltransferase / 2-methoxy-6-polyprenyl-1,4-benzoquinol methylase